MPGLSYRELGEKDLARRQVEDTRAEIPGHEGLRPRLT